MMQSPTHLVRCASHRARARLFAAMGRQPQGYWHWEKAGKYGVYGVSAAELPAAQVLNGVSRVRGDTSEWLLCWSFAQSHTAATETLAKTSGENEP